MLDTAQAPARATTPGSASTVKANMAKAKQPTAASPSRLKLIRKKGTWERGYRKHVYWLGKRKLGEVDLGPLESWDGTYAWSVPAANLRGKSTSLSKAKSCVEGALHAGFYQYDLFGYPE